MNWIKKLYGKFRPFNGVKTPTILQFSQTECGVSCLAMIFAYYHRHISLEELRSQAGISRDGSKAITLIKIAQNHGFDAQAYSVDMDIIESFTEPVIAFWNFSHYVVIEGFGTDKVFINDPSHGSMAITKEEFSKSFTGIILVISPTEKVSFKRKVATFKPILLAWMDGFKKELLFIFLCLMGIMICALINTALSKVFIDNCLISSNSVWIPFIAILSLVVSTILIMITIIQKWSQFKLYTKLSLLKTSDIISHVLQLPLLFYSLRQKSEIIAVVARAELIINLLSKSILTFLISFQSILICFMFMLLLDSFLAGVSVILTVVSILIYVFITHFNLAYEKSNLNNLGKVYAYSMACMRNLETIKACGLESVALKKWRALFYQKLMIQDKSNSIGIITTNLSKFFNSLSILFILSIGGSRVSQGLISIGNLMAYYALHHYFYNSFNSLTLTFKDAQTAYPSLLRIQDLINQNRDKRYQNNNILSLVEEISITCVDLTFYFNKTDKPTLNKLNFSIKSGEHIAIVGKSGSGKSTLAKILCGLYSAHEGCVMLSNIDISTMSSADLGKYVAYMSQDVSLFAGTIYDNLTLWNKSHSHLKIDQAIQDACLDDLMKERGLFGGVEEGGNNFSGGEKQRIDIARALIQDTPILVLDEATSALDNHTEMQIINNLRKYHKTIIYVAHRLSTIQHCDQILVLDAGEIVEMGAHRQLIERKSQYFNLIQSSMTEL